MIGISLQVGSVVVLALDGTLVYVEDVQPTYAAVVALPEQPAERADDRVFTPGRVGAKKISPYSSAQVTFKVEDISERNQKFVWGYAKWREEHGPHFVERTPEEAAAVTSKPARVKKERTAARYEQKCAECGEQPGHPRHPKDHVFVAPTVAAPVEKPARVKKERVARTPTGNTFVLVSDDLTAAKAQPRGERYNDGNRSHRVVLALKNLPASTGTIDEIVAAVQADGHAPLANPPKVVRRTLAQLVTLTNVRKGE